jgi:hypothetical protein
VPFLIDPAHAVKLTMPFNKLFEFCNRIPCAGAIAAFFCFRSYGTIGKIVTPLVRPRSVTVNDRLPVGSPSGSLTIM